MNNDIGFQVQVQYHGESFWVRGDYEPDNEDVNISGVDWNCKDITKPLFAFFFKVNFPEDFRKIVIEAAQESIENEENEHDEDYVDEDRIYEESRDRQMEQALEEEKYKEK